MKRFIAYLCLIFLGVFAFYFGAHHKDILNIQSKDISLFSKENMPLFIQVKTPFGMQGLKKQQENVYCYTQTQECGSITQIENGFQITLSDKVYTYHLKDGIFTQERNHLDSDILKENPPVQIHIQGVNKTFQTDIYGNLVDENGVLFGTIISKSIIHNPFKIHLSIQEKDKINIYEADTQQIFHKIDIQPKNYKILTFIPSYRRPIFLSGQIFRLQNQTYQNFDISVSVKGFYQHESKLTFEKEWQNLIKENRLFLFYDKNSTNQFINAVRAFDKVDISQYDYLCKIDDDDWYAPTYLETMVRHLSIQEDILLSSLGSFFTLKNEEKNAHLSQLTASTLGPTFCFKPSIGKTFIEVSNLPSQEIQNRYHLSKQELERYFEKGDDVLMKHIAGTVSNSVIQTHYPIIPYFVYGNQNASVTRK